MCENSSSTTAKITNCNIYLHWIATIRFLIAWNFGVWHAIHAYHTMNMIDSSQPNTRWLQCVLSYHMHKPFSRRKNSLLSSHTTLVIIQWEWWVHTLQNVEVTSFIYIQFSWHETSRLRRSNCSLHEWTQWPTFERSSKKSKTNRFHEKTLWQQDYCTRSQLRLRRRCFFHILTEGS